jgi:hypothetical protein
MFYLIFIITCVLLGIYFIIYFDKINNKKFILEGFIVPTDKKGFKCPNVLIQKGAEYFLYNSKLDEVPGVNPIKFDNLEDYVEFMSWQRSQGIRCPVLYLQHSYNAQSEPMYKIRPDPLDLQGGLPPAPPITSTSPTITTSNTTTYPTITTSNTTTSNNSNIIEPDDLGKITQEEAEHMTYSPNAMNDNWGGVEYTEQLIQAGVYDDNNIYI